MKEDLLHYVWRLGRFDHAHLKTTQGESISLLQKGYLNHNAGPDFLESRVKIGQTLWAGSVEMHLQSSAWYQHGHQDDPAYQKVILHVVLEEDRPVFHPDGSRIPCLVLKNRIDPWLIRNYQRLQSQSNWIPCAPLYGRIEPARRSFWLSTLAVERMEEKCEWVASLLASCQGDWDAAFYRGLAWSFGGKVNNQAMLDLANSIPYAILRKHRYRYFQLEALLFGQAGMLETNYDEPYPKKLQQEYSYLKKLYGLKPIPVQLWKFLRMRPANFPTIRIAQFTTLLHLNEHLFSRAMAAANLKELEHMFSLEVAQYWKNHFRFGVESKASHKRLGKASIHSLIINTVAPFLFHFGRERHREDLKEKALQLWEDIPAEQNAITKAWKALGQDVHTALETQALLQLKKAYCQHRKCLQCQVGQAIMSSPA